MDDGSIDGPNFATRDGFNYGDEVIRVLALMRDENLSTPLAQS
jgi:hypothetical protein